MAGQGTIVATGAIRTVGAQRLMTLTSTYDHRIIQGAEAGTFLARIEASLTGRDPFYAEVFKTLGADLAEAPESAQPEGAAPQAAPATQAAPASADDLAPMAAALSPANAPPIKVHL